MKKWLKRGLLALAFLATLIALFYAEENWRGARELARVKKELEVRGESLDPKALIPSPIPDELNVAVAPIFAELYEKDRDKTRLAQLDGLFRMRHGIPSPKIPMIGYGQGFSIAGTQKWLTGKGDPVTAVVDARAGLEEYRSLAEEIQAALARPGVRWPVTSPNNPFAEKFVYLDPLMKAARFFALRSCVEIEAGDGDAALTDVGMIFRISDVVGHRMLIGYLVGISCDAMGYGVIARGLEKEVWDDSQLSRIEGVLAANNSLVGFRDAIRQERLGVLRFQEMSREEQVILLKFGNSVENPDKVSWSDKVFLAGYLFRPRGWSSQDEAYTIRWQQRGWIDPIDPDRGVLDVDLAEEALRELNRMRVSWWQRFLRPWALVSLPPILAVEQKTALMQATLNEARIACALERWRLRNGSLPDALEKLGPELLPAMLVDPIGGRPLHYVPEADGYLLYSIGWNQKDDGGVIVRKPGSTQPDLTQGDWVWASRPDLYKFLPEKGP